MAPRITEECLVLVLVVMLWGGTTAQSQSGCMSSLMGLSPCLNYVNGSISIPTSSCCSSLSNVVQSQPQCLCMLLNANGMSSLGVTINQTLALQLPGACSVSTPPLSQCNAAADGPTASTSSPASPPTSSQTQSSDNTHETQAPTKPLVPSIPTGPGSKTVPSTNGSSDGNNIKAPLHLVVFVLFIVSCASMTTSF